MKSKSIIRSFLMLSLSTGLLFANTTFNDRATWEAALTGTQVDTVNVPFHSYIPPNQPNGLFVAEITSPVSQPWGTIDSTLTGNGGLFATLETFDGMLTSPPILSGVGNITIDLIVSPGAGAVEGFGFQYAALVPVDVTIFHDGGNSTTLQLSAQTQAEYIAGGGFFGWINCTGIDVTSVSIDPVNELQFFSEFSFSFDEADVTPPVANAGGDQAIHGCDTVNLDGTASFDDNTASESLDYAWSFLSKPAGSAASLVGADTATPDFEADTTGTYVVQLVVTDEAGLSSDADQVEISSNNLAPAADAAVDFSLAIIGQPVIFSGSDSSDPDGDELTYDWIITAAPAGSTAALDGANTANPSLTPDLEGDYEVMLTVSDCISSSAPDTVEITATTASGFAEIEIIAAGDLVEGLTSGQVKTRGNQKALSNLLRQAIQKLQNGQLDDALDMLNKALDRTDGCVLRGAPDGNGPGMDWVTDCQAQIDIYGFITAAIEALEL